MLKRIVALSLCVLFCFAPASTMVFAAENGTACGICGHSIEVAHSTSNWILMDTTSYYGESPSFCYYETWVKYYFCNAGGCYHEEIAGLQYVDQPHTFVNSPTCSVCKAYTHP